MIQLRFRERLASKNGKVNLAVLHFLVSNREPDRGMAILARPGIIPCRRIGPGHIVANHTPVAATVPPLEAGCCHYCEQPER
jgi:hypothetical protein